MCNTGKQHVQYRQTTHPTGKQNVVNMCKNYTTVVGCTRSFGTEIECSRLAQRDVGENGIDLYTVQKKKQGNMNNTQEYPE
jgi:hypothetical protein